MYPLHFPPPARTCVAEARLDQFVAGADAARGERVAVAVPGGQAVEAAHRVQHLHPRLPQRVRAPEAESLGARGVGPCARRRPLPAGARHTLRTRRESCTYAATLSGYSYAAQAACWIGALTDVYVSLATTAMASSRRRSCGGKMWAPRRHPPAPKPLLMPWDTMVPSG